MDGRSALLKTMIETFFNNKISLKDYAHAPGFFIQKLLGFKAKIRHQWINAQGQKFWSCHHLLPNYEVHSRISQAISDQIPFAIGRLGGVEASIFIWANGIYKIPYRPDLWPVFADTDKGATNAGIRPRNKESYRAFSNLAMQALESLDMQGVWRAGYEAACLPLLNPRSLFDVEITGPDGENPNHWIRSLLGKRILVVSPFAETINKQIPRLAEVWPSMPQIRDTHFDLLPFPYLIDEGCSEAWWQVYERIGSMVERGNYDVALFGCGGLGLPFAMLAKRAGRVGIHLGGHLQLVFGIYGQRHLEQEWHRKHINDAWVRPEKREVPITAIRVEGGCYW
jgi:hypothetical protein